MTYIVDFFKALGEIISSIVQFIIDLFTGLVEFFMEIPEYIEIVEGYIDMLPPFILPFVAMVLAAQLIFLIIGRRGK